MAAALARHHSAPGRTEWGGPCRQNASAPVFVQRTRVLLQSEQSDRLLAPGSLSTPFVGKIREVARELIFLGLRYRY